MTGDALNLFQFSVGQSDYGAKVEVARTEESLRRFGWVTDQYNKIDYRHTGGRQDMVAPSVVDVVGLGADLCLSLGVTRWR
jgi:hypothetical protein